MARFALLLLLLLLAFSASVLAETPSLQQDEQKPTAHFASLRSDKVNLRTGPGADFPIEWVFMRKGLPVEILAAFDTWRKIRDSEGTVGWVHQGMLSSRRSVLVTGAVRPLRQDPKPDAGIVAELEPGVVAHLSRCNPDWCEVKANGYRGWLPRDQIWGLEAGEIVQ